MASSSGVPSSSTTSAPTPSTTSAPTSSTTSAPTPTHNSTTGVSGGAVAGAAVGCYIGGILIGALICWLLLRRRKQRRPAFSPGYDEGAAGEPKGYVHESSTTSNTRREADLAPFFLDGVPDQELATELECLGDLIYQHVENSYHKQPVRQSVTLLSSELSRLGFPRDPNLAPEIVAAACIDPKNRQVGLRHVISWVLFKGIDFQQPSTPSMLPASVASFVRSIPRRRAQESQSLGLPLAMSNWRKTSALLLHPTPSDRTSLPPVESDVSSQARILTDALDPFLQHFTTAESHPGQKKHLQAVIEEGAKLGYMLFSHPNDWQLVFVGKKSGQVVVCPGLEKSSDRNGARYSPPKPVLDPTEASILLK